MTVMCTQRVGFLNHRNVSADALFGQTTTT